MDLDLSIFDAPEPTPEDRERAMAARAERIMDEELLPRVAAQSGMAVPDGEASGADLPSAPDRTPVDDPIGDELLEMAKANTGGGMTVDEQIAALMHKVGRDGDPLAELRTRQIEEGLRLLGRIEASVRTIEQRTVVPIGGA